ncbi:neprilysin-4-like isoform X2 [Sitophilus oryzae]|uniref:Neprilysin-4-like isoform X2 n=1 Tax=Sitophilus oryzae TaxID=7048 RepID=A0A6J2XBK1_SITOR|nr:neprilysin-4-like isoform X2 [Sitophilus oryzae]
MYGISGLRKTLQTISNWNKASRIMRKYMNTDVNPCENFYEYACGNWKNYYDVPPDKAVYDTFEMVRENLYIVLKELLESDYSEKPQDDDISDYHDLKDFLNENYEVYDPSDATDKAKKFYRSCMKEGTINKRGEKPLGKLLEDLGGWPLITSSWKKSDFDFMWLLSRLRLLNNDILISQWIGPDIKNSNKYIIHIDQTTLGLPNRDYFLDSRNVKFIKAYKSFILSIANLLGSQTSTTLEDIEDLVQFETRLASITYSAEERGNITEVYLRTTVETLANHFPNFAWESYFTAVLGKEIDLTYPVACYCARYLHQLLNLLNKTNPRVIQNYLLWRFVRHRTQNLDYRFMESVQKFYHALFGREKQPPRWQFCVLQTNTNMGMALGSLFIRHYFDKNSKSDTTKITENLIQAFLDMLQEKEWLDRQTKDFAQIKINNMDLKIGFPNFLLNATELNLKYRDVKIEENFFFENVLSILRHSSLDEQKKIGLYVNKSMWNTPPAVVNAYYSRNKNQILFPAGILQPPFYHKHFPKALNYGGIGVVIGHEITHGFDDKGRLFDHKGNLQLWWKNSAIEKFYEKSKCMIDQYGKYVLPGLKIPVDGFITQGENIADNGGLKQAYKAYEKWLGDNPNADESLPGLNMTGPQLFFLNFAQVWCGKQRTEITQSRLKTSVHSPGMFRVIGALSNSEDFSSIFSCPLNSPMNPQHKCVLW